MFDPVGYYDFSQMGNSEIAQIARNEAFLPEETINSKAVARVLAKIEARTPEERRQAIEQLGFTCGENGSHECRYEGRFSYRFKGSSIVEQSGEKVVNIVVKYEGSPSVVSYTQQKIK